MAASSALRSGAGLVYVLTAKELIPPLMTLCPEALGLCYEEEKGPYAVPASSSMAAPAVARVSLGDSASATYPGDYGNSKFDVFFTEKLSGKDACLIGPGIPASSDTLGAMIRIAAGRAPHLVLDAGSLEYLASHDDVMQEVSSRISKGLPPAVLTPHLGEFARFSSGAAGDEKTRASAFAAEKGVVLVLKNSETNIFTSDGKWYSNPVSNSGLAKGGSGGNMAVDMASASMGMMMGQQMMQQMQGAAQGMVNPQQAGQAAPNPAGGVPAGQTPQQAVPNPAADQDPGQPAKVVPNFCPNCGAKTNGANFCGNCGTKLV